MKKALTVSLAQTLFTIEDDAYVILDQYLQSVRTHFAANQGQEEIIKDIESRIAEQFLESGKSIITLAEVNQVIASMGAANQFGDGNDNAPSVENATEIKKKLYRNPDDAVIAGVCSGLAAYFDTPVAGVRIIFFVLFLMNGLGLLLYVILWIIMPEAKSAAQKLEMTGSPVTLATLSESVRERAAEAADKAGPTFKKVLSAPFVFIGIILRAIVTKLFPFLQLVLGLFLTGAAFCGMIAWSFFVSVILTGNPAKYTDFPVTEIVPAGILYLMIVAGYFVLLIPVLFIFLAGIALIRKKNVISASWGFGLLGLWCVALVVTGATGFNVGSSVYEYQMNSPEYQEVEKQLFLSGDEIKGLQVHDGYAVTIVQSTSTSLMVKAREKDAQNVLVKEKDGVLSLTRQEPKKLCLFCDQDAVELVLTVPSLAKISATEGSRITAKDWKDIEILELTLDSGARMNLEVMAEEVKVNLEDGARLTIIGSAATSTFTGTYGSRVEAQNFIVQNVVATVNYGARMSVNAVKNLSANAEMGGRIDYVGDAAVTEKIKDGARIEPLWPEEPEAPKALEEIE